MTEDTKRKEKLEEVHSRLKLLQATPVDEKTKSPEPNWCHQDEILGMLTSVTESLHATVTSRELEQKHLMERLGSLESDIAHMRADIQALCKVVRDGNGQPSMIQRLANLEVVVSNNKADIAEVKGHANSIIAAKALSKSQVIAGLIGIIVTALLSTLALVATLMK